MAVLEGLNDHENIGALFRNAAAFGVGGVLLDPRCADPLYRRSIRVSVGHALRIPFARLDPWPAALDEVRAAPLDEAGRARLKEIYETSLVELSAGLSEDLREELRSLRTRWEQEKKRIEDLQANVDNRFNLLERAKKRAEYVKYQEKQKEEKEEKEEESEEEEEDSDEEKNGDNNSLNDKEDQVNLLNFYPIILIECVLLLLRINIL